MPAALNNPLYQSNRTRRTFVGGPVSFSDAAGAMAGEASALDPTEQLGRVGDLRTARGHANVIADDGSDIAQPDIAGRLSPEAQKRRIADAGLDGRLEPVEGESEEGLALKIKWKREEIARQSILANADRGAATQAGLFLTGVGASIMDPINIASAFVPAIGPARYASMLAKQASRLGRFGVRTRVGAIEGAVGAALVEPIVLAAAQETQADYDLYDTFFNLAAGSVLGGGLHGAGGFAKDVVSGRVLDRVPAETRREAMASSVGALVQGRKPVLAEEILRRDLMASTSISRGIDPAQRIALEGSLRNVAGETPPFQGTTIPSVSRSGQERIYDTREKAESAARRMRGSETEVRQTGDGRYAVVRQAEGVSPLRDPDGNVRVFNSERAANKFKDRVRDVPKDAVPVRYSEGVALVTGATERDLQAMRAAPERVRFGDPASRPARPQSEIEGPLELMQAATPEANDNLARRDAASDAMERQFSEAADVFGDEIAAAPRPAPDAGDTLETDIAGIETQIEAAALELGEQLDDAGTRAAAENLDKVRAYGNGLRRAAACIIGAFG